MYKSFHTFHRVLIPDDPRLDLHVDAIVEAYRPPPKRFVRGVNFFGIRKARDKLYVCDIRLQGGWWRVNPMVGSLRLERHATDWVDWFDEVIYLFERKNNAKDV